MLVTSFFEWLNLDRFREKIKSMWISFVRFSLLSVQRCYYTHFFNLLTFNATLTIDVLISFIVKITVLFALISFMSLNLNCCWSSIWTTWFSFVKSSLIISSLWMYTLHKSTKSRCIISWVNIILRCNQNSCVIRIALFHANDCWLLLNMSRVYLILLYEI